MSTNTLPLGLVPGNADAFSASDKPTFFERLFAGMIAARTRQGEAHVAAVLGRMSDRQLADIGFGAEEIASIRATGRVPGTRSSL